MAGNCSLNREYLEMRKTQVNSSLKVRDTQDKNTKVDGLVKNSYTDNRCSNKSLSSDNYLSSRFQIIIKTDPTEIN